MRWYHFDIFVDQQPRRDGIQLLQLPGVLHDGRSKSLRRQFDFLPCCALRPRPAGDTQWRLRGRGSSRGGLMRGGIWRW